MNTATETVSHRTRSRIGSVQRHFRVSPPIDGHAHVAVTHGIRDCYLFPADPHTGAITDPTTPLRRIDGTDTDAALAGIGYRVA